MLALREGMRLGQILTAVAGWSHQPQGEAPEGETLQSRTPPRGSRHPSLREVS
jgi:hypothetical protein